MAGVLVEGHGMTQGHTEKACEDWDRDGRDASPSQGMPGIADNHRKLGGALGTDSPSESQGGTNPADTLVSDI